MERKVLVLTRWFFPCQILRWEDAVRLIYVGSASVVAEYDEELRSPSVTWKMPAVIVLKKDVRAKKKGVKYSPFNMFVRDKFTCQYCGDRKKQRELTRDHVVPRARGGRTTWENTVTACRPCNSQKGSMTCDEAGMFPLHDPVRPQTLPLTAPVADLDRAPEEWHPFLQPYLQPA
jgi:5-methylcytosine-specific restriction endonuclease McrA